MSHAGPRPARWFRRREPDEQELAGVRIVCPIVREKPRDPARWLAPVLLAIAIGQLALLAAAVWEAREQLNGDAVAYLRLAMYYASGRLDLAVSGYWGPMLSWLTAPLLWVLPDPLLSIRIAMAASALVFLLGSISLFRRLELPPGAVAVGAAVVALMGVRHAGGEITPDLLVSGLVCFGAAQLLSRTWRTRRRTQLAAGALFGAAYLAKAVALPVFFGSALVTTVLWMACRPRERAATAGALAVTTTAFAAVAGPWIAVLSLEYGRPLFSTTARVAHAWVGPRDEYRFHSLDRAFIAPEAGRITTWEDPTRELPYNYWSPLESRAYFVHQLRVIGGNAQYIARTISRLDAFGLGLLLLVLGALVHWPWREGFLRERWRWAAIIVACGTAIYLPVFAGCPRYFYFAVPFLLTLGLGLVTRLAPDGETGGRNLGRLVGVALIAVSFGGPQLQAIAWRLRSPRPRPDWLLVADAVRREGLAGPVAGGPLTAMQTALMIDDPFLGGIAGGTVDEYRSSGARLFIVNRDGPAAERLSAAPDFEDLDGRLFGDAAAKPELQVFGVETQRTAGAR